MIDEKPASEKYAAVGRAAKTQKPTPMTIENPTPPTALPPRWKKFTLFFVVALGVLAVDWATKQWVLETMPLYTQKVVIPGFFNLVHVRNTGVAFSFFAGAETPWRVPVLAGLTVAALGVVFFLYRECGPEEKVKRLALSLIAGGASGNLTDRLRFGNVVDFLDFYLGPYHWPAFNVADMAVTLGAAGLLFALLRGETKKPRRR